MRRFLELLPDLLSLRRFLPDLTRRRHSEAYEVSGPTTVFVRAGHSQVFVRRAAARRVQIAFDLRQPFGWQWVTERDEAGVYVVLKRRPIVGTLATACLRLTVPPDAYLVFHLTPGSVCLEDVEGRLAVAPPSTSPDPLLTPGERDAG